MEDASQQPQRGNERRRLFIKVTRESLPRASDRYPFIYLERGRLEIDDSSVKWISSECDVVRIPVATLNCILLGPGTSVTHEAVKVAAAANCQLCWVGEDSLLFYAHGDAPTADTSNLRRQADLSSSPDLALEVAKAMFRRRFPTVDLENKTLPDLMGMEGIRVRRLYEAKAEEYQVGWKGRQYQPGHFELSDMTNQILTAANAALYAVIGSVVHALGYSPHLGFIHSGSPLPLVYDLADLYKADLCIDLAFAMTKEMAGEYNGYTVSENFRKRVLDMDLMLQVCKDLEFFLGEKSARGYRKRLAAGSSG